MNFTIPYHFIRSLFLNLLLLILFLSLPNSNNIFGQTIIKEKIEIITPYISNIQKGINTIASNSHTVRFEMDWDKSNRDGFIRVVYPSNLDHNMTGWIDGGSLDLTVDGFIAPVYIMFQFKVNLYTYEPTTVNYRMFVDGSEVVAGTSILTGRSSSIPYKNVVYFLDEEEDNCEDSACDDNTFNTPQFIIRELKNENFDKYDFNNTGYAGLFLPFFENSKYKIGKDEIIESINASTCYNTDEQFWKYSLPDDSIYLNALLDVFDANINHFTIIESFGQLDNLTDEEACLAIKDCEDRKLYGGGDGRDGMYYLKDVTELHETAHKGIFIKLIDDVLQQKTNIRPYSDNLTYKKWLTALEPQCDDYSSPILAKQFWEMHISKVTDMFLDELEIKYEEQKERSDNETQTHKTENVQSRIKEYIKYLEIKYPNRNCN